NTRYLLTVTRGPDAGVSFDFDATHPSRVLIGQSPACELRLTDPHVSRRHAALDMLAGGLSLIDLGSTNGTFANGMRVAQAFLQGGETVVVGETEIQIGLGARDQHTLPRTTRFGRMLGASPEMRRLYPICERIASTDLPVVIEGETGTGKEVLAEA